MIGAGNIDVKTTAVNRMHMAALSTDLATSLSNTGLGGTGNIGVADTIVACGSSNIPIDSTHDTLIYITYSVIKNNNTLDNQSALNLQHKKSQCTLYIPTYIMTPQSEAIYQSVREKKIPFLNVISGRIDNVLPFRDSKDVDDEKHVHPLQLDVIDRIVELYSNPNEVVLTPFMGVGSEVFSPVSMGRKAIGIELKDSYFKQAILNLNEAEKRFKQSQEKQGMIVFD
jgi:hypothetical protein